MSDAQRDSVWGPLWERIAKIDAELCEVIDECFDVEDVKGWELINDLIRGTLERKAEFWDSILPPHKKH